MSSRRLGRGGSKGFDGLPFGVGELFGDGHLDRHQEVAVPQRLTDAEREAVEALAAANTESPRRHLGV